MNQQRKPRSKYSTDNLMHQIQHQMIKDFQDHSGDPLLFNTLDTAIQNRDVRGIRECTPVLDDRDGVWLYKAKYQIASLNKRHRYRKDIYTDAELEEKAISTFLETQSRICAVDLPALSLKTQQVLRLARVYISHILGEYDDEECRRLARFGSGASVGVPARSASLAQRFCPPISGSKQQIDWFDAEMRHDNVIQDFWKTQMGDSWDPETDRNSLYQEIETLKLVFVPKSYKSLRSIMPNTTIGSYMSFGLGMMIQQRLNKKACIDIRKAQMRHRKLACLGSSHEFLVTVDLSSASDSISTALVNHLLPDDWFKVLNDHRIGLVELPNGSSVQSETFCTMGVGYTFCLQTLIFLALLKAVEAANYGCKDRGIAAVYGDDMIYDRRMHTEVLAVFSEIGFVVNEEKTFAHGHFRESCGGDYYRGVDVRPFQPQNGAAHVGSRVYEAVLYKHINGLLMRWSEYEIERTLRFLASELERVTRSIKIVPLNHPDDSGIKVSDLRAFNFLNASRVAKPKHMGHGIYRFSYLRLTPTERKEERHGPYLWASLRGVDLRTFHYSSKHSTAEPVGYLVQLINWLTNADRPPSYLVTRPRKDSIAHHSKQINSGMEQSRKMEDYVTISHTGLYTRQVGFSLYENRG